MVWAARWSWRGACKANLSDRANCAPAGHETLFEGRWAGYEFDYDGVGATHERGVWSASLRLFRLWQLRLLTLRFASRLQLVSLNRGRPKPALSFLRSRAPETRSAFPRSRAPEARSFFPEIAGTRNPLLS